MSVWLGTDRQRKRERLSKSEAATLCHTKVIFRCDECRVYHVLPEIGDDRNESTWAFIKRLLGRMRKGGAA